MRRNGMHLLWMIALYAILVCYGSARASDTERALHLISTAGAALRDAGEYRTKLLVTEHFQGKHFYSDSVEIAFSRHLNKVRGQTSGTFSKTYVVDLRTQRLRGRVFPIPYTMDLSPYDKLALKDQHQPSHFTGLRGFYELFQRYIKRSQAVNKVRFHDLGIRTLHGKQLLCYTQDHEDYKEGKTVVVPTFSHLGELEQKLDTSLCLLRGTNPSLSSYWDIKEGMRLYVPKTYGKALDICFDQTSGLMVYQKVYDHEGRPFGEYHYQDIRNNQRFTAADFEL